jgi:hypothetical protein
MNKGKTKDQLHNYINHQEYIIRNSKQDIKFLEENVKSKLKRLRYCNDKLRAVKHCLSQARIIITRMKTNDDTYVCDCSKKNKSSIKRFFREVVNLQL